MPARWHVVGEPVEVLQIHFIQGEHDDSEGLVIVDLGHEGLELRHRPEGLELGIPVSRPAHKAQEVVDVVLSLIGLVGLDSGVIGSRRGHVISSVVVSCYPVLDATASLGSGSTQAEL